MRAIIHRASTLRGSLQAPGDKSISHRALILAALGTGTVQIDHLAPGADVRSTARCLGQLGVAIDWVGDSATVIGAGLRGLRAPTGPLDCGNSGTTLRLLCGVIAGAGIGATLDGDASLRGRPMKRVLEPLRAMGANARGVPGRKGEEVAPLTFAPGHVLHGARHDLAIASAQVKSCLLLAGLGADGPTSVREPSPSRDHTERMMRAFGVDLQTGPDDAVTLAPEISTIRPPPRLEVPGDPSAAAFALVAGLLVPGAEVAVRGVDVNPTRTGLLSVLARMGAEVESLDEPACAGDPVATLSVRGGQILRGTRVELHEVPSLIDELPILAILATQAHGLTEIRGAGELRFKESDRLAELVRGLQAMGAKVEEHPDGLVIDGPTPLHAAALDAARNHRIAMSFAVAGLVAEGETCIDGAEWADISFPGFFTMLGQWSGGAVRLG